MLPLIVVAIAAAPLPSERELGFALAYSQRCVDSDGLTLCGPEPTGAKFSQYLCVEYGADQAKRAIVRCVYKGARMIMPRFRGVTRTIAFGDGAIDVIYQGGDWLPYR